MYRSASFGKVALTFLDINTILPFGYVLQLDPEPALCVRLALWQPREGPLRRRVGGVRQRRRPGHVPSRHDRSREAILCDVPTGFSSEIGPLGKQGPAAALRQHCPQMTQRHCTGVAKRVLPRLRECSRQVEAEVVSNSRNNIHQTWGAIFRRPL